jgi:hypothetical protein
MPSGAVLETVTGAQGAEELCNMHYQLIVTSKSMHQSMLKCAGAKSLAQSELS